MSAKEKANLSPRISNRRALHDYFFSAKLECGIVLKGSEVKSLRQGKAQLQDAYARVEGGELILHNVHIDPYEKAALAMNHEAKRSRKLLAHKREIKRLIAETADKGTTLIPLAMYFKDGRVKVELGVGKGKQQHDKRESIRRREIEKDIRRAMSHRQ